MYKNVIIANMKSTFNRVVFSLIIFFAAAKYFADTSRPVRNEHGMVFQQAH